MIYQILNGDSLARNFATTRISGDVIVMRECLIEGDLSGSTMIDFWRTRANYLASVYKITMSEYFRSVVAEFEKMKEADDDSEFNLWFEYDLFCQVNLWFLISFLNDLPIRKKVFVVYSTYLKQGTKDFWSGFGPANSEELNSCYHGKIILTGANLVHGNEMWKAYRKNDLEQLSVLSKDESAGFPHTKEVVDAHIQRFAEKGRKGRPEKALEAILANQPADFGDVFRKFQETESIYGFGDAQVKQLYDKIIAERN